MLKQRQSSDSRHMDRRDAEDGDGDDDGEDGVKSAMNCFPLNEPVCESY